MDKEDRLMRLIWYTAILRAAGVYDEPRLTPEVDLFRFFKFCDVYKILTDVERESV